MSVPFGNFRLESASSNNVYNSFQQHDGAVSSLEHTLELPSGGDNLAVHLLEEEFDLPAVEHTPLIQSTESIEPRKSFSSLRELGDYINKTAGKDLSNYKLVRVEDGCALIELVFDGRIEIIKSTPITPELAAKIQEQIDEEKTQAKKIAVVRSQVITQPERLPRRVAVKDKPVKRSPDFGVLPELINQTDEVVDLNHLTLNDLPTQKQQQAPNYDPQNQVNPRKVVPEVSAEEIPRREVLAKLGILALGAVSVFAAKGLGNPKNKRPFSGPNETETWLQERSRVLAAERKERLAKQASSRLPKGEIGNHKGEIDPLIAGLNKGLELEVEALEQKLGISPRQRSDNPYEELRLLSDPKLRQTLLDRIEKAKK
jgi:hypothetical protein